MVFLILQQKRKTDLVTEKRVVNSDVLPIGNKRSKISIEQLLKGKLFSNLRYQLNQEKFEVVEKKQLEVIVFFRFR